MHDDPTDPHVRLIRALWSNGWTLVRLEAELGARADRLGLPLESPERCGQAHLSLIVNSKRRPSKPLARAIQETLPGGPAAVAWSGLPTEDTGEAPPARAQATDPGPLPSETVQAHKRRRARGC